MLVSVKLQHSLREVWMLQEAGNLDVVEEAAEKKFRKKKEIIA
jgi:hypothetical protein